MKKLILAASLFLFGAQAKATLYINNNSNCTLNITMFAFDPTHPGCWGLQSNLITVGPTDAATPYPTVASLNTMPPYWFGGATASTAGGSSTWGWNAGKFFFTGSAGGATVGVASCGLSMSETVPNPCGGGTITVTWIPLPGTNNILIEAN